jgi:hypothetical protein
VQGLIAGRRHEMALVLALYAGLTIVVTWPLITQLDVAVPQTLLDPLLNCWILAWDSERLLGIFGGHFSEVNRFWQGNIFHPQRDALAYSEHLIPQAIQSLPVYALTHSVLLGYNLLFLSTFALSGLGMFCWVRELTGRPGAALLAGMLYLLLPYRADHYAHLQVLSSQWMPLAFFGITRYFKTGRLGPLLAAAAATVIQGLSCGYYLLFFATFLVLYVLFEMHRHRRSGDARAWRDVLLAAAVVIAVTSPFLVPYLRLRSSGDIVRSREEVLSYSADLESYASAPDPLRFWGTRLPSLGRSEVQLFPGLTPLILIGSAVALVLWRRVAPLRRECWSWPVVVLTGLALFQVVMSVLILTGHPQRHSIGPLDLRFFSVRRALAIAAVAAAGALALSPRSRVAVVSATRSVPVFLAGTALLAGWLSLGPVVHIDGTAVSAFGLYGVLYEHVPGFDGLRVPARMGMIVGLFISALAGWAAAQLSRGFAGTVGLVALGGAVALFEGCAAPISLLAAPACSPIYESVAALPEAAVIAELPFGDPYRDVQYMFCSTRHWRRLVNGYSGAVPAGYSQRASALRAALREPDAAWASLVDSGATDVVVHQDAWPGARGPRVSAWLEEHGARRRAVAGADVLYGLGAPRAPAPGARGDTR